MSVSLNDIDESKYRPALIWREQSLPQDDDQSDPRSTQSRISRARGSGKLALLDDTGSVTPIRDLEPPLYPEQQFVVLFDNEPVASDAPYSMILVRPDHSHLSPARILRMPEYGEIPLAEPQIMGFSDEVRKRLRHNQIVKVMVNYDAQEHSIHGGEAGWGRQAKSGLEAYISIAKETGDHIAAWDYVLATFGSRVEKDLQEIADLRGAEVDDIRENISEVYSQIHQDSEEIELGKT